MDEKGRKLGVLIVLTIYRVFIVSHVKVRNVGQEDGPWGVTEEIADLRP